MELIDILDAEGNKTGEIKTRDVVHRLGYWHKAIHVWIVNSKNQILLQKRADWLRSNPGMWDVSVGGHLESEEDNYLSAVREIKEESGIEVRPNELHFLFKTKRQVIKNNNTYVNNEFDDVFLLQRDLKVNELHTGEEVSDWQWIDISDLKDKVNRKAKDLVMYEEEYNKLFEYLDCRMCK